MSGCFADTAYYVALLNFDDDGHESARRFTEDFAGTIVTTSAILNELGNYLAQPPNRALFNDLVQAMREDSSAQVVHVDERLFAAGVELFRARTDKEWSLTDRIARLTAASPSPGPWRRASRR